MTAAASVTITGLNAWVKKTAAQKARIKVSAAQFVQRKVKEILVDLAKGVPQWSGDLAASWRVVNQAKTSVADAQAFGGYSDFKGFPDWRNVDPIRFRGDSTPVRYVTAINESTIKSLKYNSRISITNVSPTAKRVASGDITRFRPGNTLGAMPQEILAIAYVRAKYRYLA